MNQQTTIISYLKFLARSTTKSLLGDLFTVTSSCLRIVVPLKRRGCGYFLSLIIFVAVFVLSSWEAATAQSTGAKHPNFVIIIADDMVRDDVELGLPYASERIFKEGVTFERGYVTTPWCCPSRSSIFTGKYAHRHGVRQNITPLEGNTIFHDLQAAGYFTGLIGKYLNSWNGVPRPEFSFWSVFPFGNTLWLNPAFVNTINHPKYQKIHVMDVTRYYTRAFFDSHSKNPAQPFLLTLSSIAPHRPAIPERKYAKEFQNLDPIRDPNFGCEKRKGKPNWVMKRRCPKPVIVKRGDDFRLRQLRSLLSLDELVRTVFFELESRSLLDSTMVFFISDNGLLRGDFGLYDKPFPYERAVHVPFALRYPALFQAGQRVSALAANIDIPATIYHFADVSPTELLDGLSLHLVPPGSDQWRTHLLLEGFGAEDGGDPKRKSFVSILDERYQILLHRGDIFELYDLSTDPFQLDNRASDPLLQIRARDLFKVAKTLRPDILQEGWLPKEVRRQLEEP